METFEIQLRPHVAAQGWLLLSTAFFHDGLNSYRNFFEQQVFLLLLNTQGYAAINLSISESYFSNSLLFRSPASVPKLEANTGHLPEATGIDWPLKPSCSLSTPRAAWMLTDASNSAYQALGSGLFQHHPFWWPHVSSKTDAVSSGKKAQLMELSS